MTRRPLLGIGIGAPGVIDTRAGIVRWSVNLDWADLRLGPIVEERYGVPVVVANDSHAAALAELTFHRRPRPNNLIVIKVGRGIGAGIIVNGQLFQGDGYGAGEFGHVSLGRDETPCRCGRDGLPRDADQHAGAGGRRPGRRSPRSPTSPPRRGLHGRASWASGGSSSMPRASSGSPIGWLIGVLNVRHVLLVGPVVTLRRGLAGRGPPTRRGRASWGCWPVTRRSSSATSTTTWSSWARRRCSWNGSSGWGWRVDRDP